MIKNNAIVIDFSDFSQDFFNAVVYWFKDTRVNGYQRIYVEDDDEYEYHHPDNDDPYVPEYEIIQNELRAKGFTEQDIILVNNSW